MSFCRLKFKWCNNSHSSRTAALGPGVEEGPIRETVEAFLYLENLCACEDSIYRSCHALTRHFQSRKVDNVPASTKTLYA